MSEHTKGPWVWEVSDAYGYSSLWNPETREEILIPGCEVHECDVWMGEELTKANARLIAASPDMLEALEPFAKEALSLEADSPEFNGKARVAVVLQVDDLRAAIAAISKATGGAG